jgi:4-amino-4-deoxy-L-arabinose transferase-like glycosyltransferase
MLTRLTQIHPDLRSVIVVAILITLLSFALNIGLSLGQLGTYNLTLDDAWIHQTYARNLAQGRWFVYTGGQASSGSTAPAWTMLLSLGYLLGFDPTDWSLVLGALFHILTAVIAFYLSLANFGDRWLAAWSAALTALEWHLVWAALSGMETTLFVALSLLYLYLIQAQWQRTWLMGLSGGLLFLVRPEAALLVAIAGLKVLWIRRHAWRQALKSLVLMGLMFLLVISPILLFNTAVSGRPLPGTLHAKFAQWIAPWTIGKGLGYLELVLKWFWLRGPLFLLFPLALASGWLAWRRRMRDLIPTWAWTLGLPLSYTFLLPSIGERGRYLMPLVPLVIILGAWAASEFLRSTQFKRLGWALVILATLMTLAFWFNGTRAYILNVRSLESQHMVVARWLRDHTPPDAVIAAQDIGVLAYFSDRRLIDMAGLTEPAVVPIMHQPEQMAAYIRQQGGDYVVVFPSHYQQFIDGEDLQLVFVSDKYDFYELASDPLAVFQFLSDEEDVRFEVGDER